MATYIALLNWTDKGVSAFRDTLTRADAARDAATRLGGSLSEIYWTIGPYDIVAVAEFPDDETATAYMLALGGQGNIRTTTLRAFAPSEVGAIIDKLH